MSTQAIGTILNPDGSPRPAAELATFTVAVLSGMDLRGGPLASGTPAPDGTFSLSYPVKGGGPIAGVITLGVTNRVGRVLYQATQSDVPGTLDFGPIRADDTTSWAVSLGLPSGSPKPFFSQGNTVRFLVDNEAAWGYLASRLPTGGTHPISVKILELEFDIPDFNSNPAAETSKIVFAFGSPLDATHLRAVSYPADFRPERRMLDIAGQGVPIRFMINDPQLFDVVPFNPVAAPFGLEGQYPDISRYFTSAGSSVIVQRFPINFFGRVHAKMFLIDDKEVVVVASPLIQGYYDTNAHAVDEPKRGTGVQVPIHDTSMAVRGPAVAAMHHAYLLHWNLMRPGDLQEISVPAATPGTGETAASLQLARSINQGIFNVVQGDPVPLANGEKGILEAYLRAIDMAQDLLYFENQYFTNETIGNAVVRAILAKPQLRAIFLINVVPDLPFYPIWQANLIQGMRSALAAQNLADRVGFFTAWSHEATPGGPGVANMMGNYIHSKLAIADNSWATVGSANLDGTSLDFTQGLHVFHDHDWRSHELNYLIFDGIEGQPGEGSTDQLRKMAWSEHLGLAMTDASLNYTSPSGAAFMNLWRGAASAKLSGLQNAPAVPVKARILEFPDPAPGAPGSQDPSGTYDAFLRAARVVHSGIGLTGLGQPTLRLQDRVRSFSFATGKWTS